MTLVIKQLPDKLQEISRKINDSSIKCQIDRLVEEARDTGKSVRQAFSVRGNEILQMKGKLSRIRCPRRVDVDGLSRSLLAFQTDAKYCCEKAFKMKGSIHYFIETCRVTKRAKENEMGGLKIEISGIQTKIKLAENDIQRFETEAQNEERAAVQLDKRARYLRDKSERHHIIGAVWGILNVTVGLVLAPFTLGISLLPTLASAGIGMAINFDSANDCDRWARSLRSSAEDKRERAQRQRQLMREFEMMKNSKVNDMQYHKRVLYQLSETFDGLIDLERQLQISVSGFENAIRCVQDFQSAIHLARLQGDAFELIKELFEECPEEFSEEAHQGLFDLKIKWGDLEQLLLQHSR